MAFSVWLASGRPHWSATVWRVKRLIRNPNSANNGYWADPAHSILAGSINYISWTVLGMPASVTWDVYAKSS